MTPVTVIATVLNEGESIHHLMQSLSVQTYRPDAIIIVDGGSRDQTVAILQTYQAQLPLQVLIEPGCNISRGRNLAIAASQDGIIVATDAGVRFGPDWLAHLIRPFQDDPRIEMVSGFFRADPQTPFEVAMGATVLPLADEINPTGFLPSSRSVAFLKSVWQAAGGYPEWLDYCEDLVFDLRVLNRIQHIRFAPQAVVLFRPRGSLRAFYKQYYLYARGDGKADLWRKRHLIRYLTYLIVLPALLILTLFVHPIFGVILAFGAVIYLIGPYRRLAVLMRSASDRSWRAWITAILMIPVIRLVGDLAKMIGYPVGIRWRLQHNPPNWRN
ncbi:MAG: glycosyltransferase [Anaerolineae bacterium]|nr:glycosyltransferase [Anaerolineae bacterium]